MRDALNHANNNIIFLKKQNQDLIHWIDKLESFPINKTKLKEVRDEIFLVQPVVVPVIQDVMEDIEDENLEMIVTIGVIF